MLRGLGTLVDISASFYKVDNFRDILFAFLKAEAFW